MRRAERFASSLPQGSRSWICAHALLNAWDVLRAPRPWRALTRLGPWLSRKTTAWRGQLLAFSSQLLRAAGAALAVVAFVATSLGLGWASYFGALDASGERSALAADVPQRACRAAQTKLLAPGQVFDELGAGSLDAHECRLTLSNPHGQPARQWLDQPGPSERLARVFASNGDMLLVKHRHVFLEPALLFAIGAFEIFAAVFLAMLWIHRAEAKQALATHGAAWAALARATCASSIARSVLRGACAMALQSARMLRASLAPCALALALGAPLSVVLLWHGLSERPALWAPARAQDCSASAVKRLRNLPKAPSAHVFDCRREGSRWVAVARLGADPTRRQRASSSPNAWPPETPSKARAWRPSPQHQASLQRAFAGIEPSSWSQAMPPSTLSIAARALAELVGLAPDGPASRAHWAPSEPESDSRLPWVLLVCCVGAMALMGLHFLWKAARLVKNIARFAWDGSLAHLDRLGAAPSFNARAQRRELDGASAGALEPAQKPARGRL